MSKHLKKIISVFMVVLMLTGSAPLDGFKGLDFSFLTELNISLPEIDFNMFSLKSHALEENGFTYTAIDDTYCTITGYTGTDTEVIVPSELGGYIVQKIGSNAFYAKSSIINLVLPETITDISANAFSSCSNLVNLELQEGITKLSNYAFSGCTSLENLVLPESITTFGYRIFDSCIKLKEINIPLSLTTVNYYENFISYQSPSVIYAPFSYSSIEKVITPDGLTSIPAYTLYGCSNLTDITLPDSLLSIGSYAFAKCTSLTEITFPDGLSSIGSYVFDGCTEIKEIVLPSGIEKCSYMLSGSSVETVIISNGVETVPTEAFVNCKSIKNVYIPSSVKSIGSGAFAYCYALESVEIAAGGLTKIGKYAFRNCYALSELTLPDSVSIIEYGFIEGCSSLKHINYPASLTTCTYDYDSNNKVIRSTIFSESSIESVTFPDNLDNIAAYAFCDAKTIQTIDLPENIKSIGDYAFYNCTAIQTIEIPDGVTEIGNSAFSGCTAIQTINIPDGVKLIDYSTFAGCSSLAEIEMPGALEIIRQNAFLNCVLLEKVSLPDGITTIEANAFKGCSLLNKIVLPDSITRLGYSIFDGCAKLTSINYPLNLASCESKLQAGPFANSGIKSITIPDGVTKLPDTVFGSCYFLTNVNIPESVQVIEGHAFTYCKALKYIKIPENVKQIGWYTFSYCSALETVELPNGLQKIVEFAFSDCTNLKDLVIPQNVTSIDSKSFYGCKNTTFYCYYNSYAHQYFKTKDLKYELLFDHEHDVVEVTTIAPTCTLPGKKTLTCSICGYVTIDDAPATGHSFSDWTEIKKPTVLTEGKMSRTCSVCSTVETKATDRITIDIGNTNEYGIANFTVVNAQTLAPVENANIFISTAKDGENTFSTDAEGKVSITLPVGEQVVSVYADGCIVRTIKITVNPGVNEIPEIGLSDKNVYDATLDHHLMTKEEIEDAEIDIENTENNQVYKYEIEFKFTSETDIENIYFYFNENGTVLGGGSSDSTSGSTWIDDGNGNGHISIPRENEPVINVYPVSEYFYLIIQGEIRWLKEMFDVEMLVFNNSQTDTLENVVATLDLPEGLSLADLSTGEQTLSYTLGTINSGESKSAHWYVRGDKAGSYNISANLTGTIMPFEEDIDETFVAENQLQVWAGDALELHFEFPDAAFYGEDYTMLITLTNISDITLYNVGRAITGIEQSRLTHYSDGSEKTQVIVNEDYVGNFFAQEFKPGDKIYIELSSNIIFESEILEKSLNEFLGKIDDIEQFVNAYKAVGIGLDVATDVVNTVSGTVETLKAFVNGSPDISEDKLSLINDLKVKIEALYSDYLTDGNKLFGNAAKIIDAEIFDSLKAINADAQTFFNETSAEDIQNLTDNISSLTESIELAQEFEDFDIFNSLRTTVSALPVCFALQSVIFNEYYDNTTSIPWTYSVKNTNTQKANVEKVDDYIDNLLRALIAEVGAEGMPSSTLLISGIDNNFDYDEVKREILATENEVSKFLAKDATGKNTFRAWMESDDNFDISCDNTSASYIDGVLQFAGEGTITVIPGEGASQGILHIVDGDGNIYEFVIKVIAPHECVAGEREIILNPTDTTDGFAVRRCQYCEKVLQVEILLSTTKSFCKEHNFTQWVTEVALSCIANGIRTRECTVCGYCQTEYLKNGPHDWDDGVIDPASTCKTHGTKTYTCQNDASHTYTEDVALDENNHVGDTYIKDNKDATCTEDGYTGDTYCSDCDKQLESGEVIPATGHDWGNWTTVKESSYTEMGTEKRICNNCGAEETRPLPVLTRPSDENENIETEKTVEYDSATGEAVIKLVASSKGEKITVNSRTPLDIVLVLDQSGSMEGDLLKKLKTATDDFTKAIYKDAVDNNIDHRIAMVGFAMQNQYNFGSEYPQYLNTEILTTGGAPVKYNSLSTAKMNEVYRNALVSVNVDGALNPILTLAKNNLEAKGATAADLGLDMACQIFAQNENDGSRKRIVVFMTDGVPTYKSDYMEETATNATTKANLLKDAYEADLYSVGVLSGSNTNKAKTFLNNIASKDENNKALYFDCADADKLVEDFQTIATQSTTVTTDFADITLIDTVSSAFTLTAVQENELRKNAIEKLGITNDDITVTRYADGTTEVKLEHINPVAISDGDDINYVIDIDFRVTANEKALIAGSYGTNTDNAGVLIGTTDVYENNFAVPGATVENAEGVIYFTVNGIVYHVVRVHKGDTPEAPEFTLDGEYTFSGWDIPDEVVFDGGKLTVDATLTQKEYTVTWNTEDGTITDTYYAGDMILVPEVGLNAKGEEFIGWDNDVPVTMPAENLELTAIYGKHEHEYSENILVKVSCGVEGKVQYVCDCGHSYTETVTALTHKWATSATSSDVTDTAYSHVYCENCGESPDKTLEYTIKGTTGWNNKVTYDLKLTDAENITVQPDGEITISLPVPQNMKNARNITIYREEADGTLTNLNGTVKNGYITFTTTHFSIYIIEAEYECAETGNHTDEDADNICDICESDIIPEVPETPEDPSEDCDHYCHQTGFMNFLWKIFNFLFRLFGIEDKHTCDCGAAHW